MEAFLLVDRTSPGLAVVATGGALEELTGLVPEQVVGRPWPRMWRGHGDAQAVEVLRGAAERGESASVRVPAAGLTGAVETNATMLPLHGDSALALCRIAETADAEEVAYLAFHDRLTGLPNRTLLERHLSLALPRALR